MLSARLPTTPRRTTPKGGDVVQGADDQGPDHYFGMDGGPPVAGAITILQRSCRLGEIKLLINADQQMVRVDEVPHAPAGELEQSRISSVAVQWLQHPLTLSLLCIPGIINLGRKFIISSRGWKLLRS